MDPEDRDQSNRSAIYLLRTVQQHHVQLSAMADQKASIILGAAFVVLAIVFGQSAAGNGVPIPLIVLAGTVTVSGLLAAMAVLPGAGSKGQANANLLFFGHFCSLPEDEYVDRLCEILESEDSVHRAMARDIYQMGQFLRKRKYAYLKWSYQCLILGGVLCAGAFLGDLLGRF